LKVVIFAGGRGSRLGTLSKKTPKPLIEVSGVPIIFRIIEYYKKHGFNDLEINFKKFDSYVEIIKL
jgi:glucose-1-phosphate cytidylyltransferase